MSFEGDIMGYDIFISYKYSDENGNPTEDFAIAKELYNAFSKLGYNTFFSDNSLKDIASSRYKSDIDTALDSAKLMIVVLTKASHAYSHWVQYEWDSYYNDFLSGVRKEAFLFTLTKNVDVHDLPRTLRNVQNFDYDKGLNVLCEYIRNAFPKRQAVETAPLDVHSNISIITGHQVTIKDIEQAVKLDSMVYDDIYHVDTSRCEKWFDVNPDIYVMAKDSNTGNVVAYANLSPVTDECYEQIKNGHFIDTEITEDMILSYDMPFPYSVYFSSIVIHPEHQNTEVFMKIFNAIIDKFITLGKHEVFVRRMIADAVTKNGEKFCNLFGMTKVKNSHHNSSLYEVSMIPPKFRVMSKKTKQLYDYYKAKYEDDPYLFDEIE